MFKKKSGRRVRGSVAEVVPDDATAAIEDAALIEQAAHAFEKSLKRFAACRRDEADKVQRIVSVLPGERPPRAASPTGTNVASQWLRVEEGHNEMITHMALDPLRQFATVFPEVNGVAAGYIRAANDFRKAKDKLRQAELKGKDTHKAAQVVRVTEAEFDKLSKLVPHAFSELLKHRYEYFDEVLRGLLTANVSLSSPVCCMWYEVTLDSVRCGPMSMHILNMRFSSSTFRHFTFHGAWRSRTVHVRSEPHHRRIPMLMWKARPMNSSRAYVIFPS
eukprot:m.116844 g.116844  ORF g.116844 m.116844 type:complete len:276 (-) comp10931_c0_seq6:204-1031(-)